MKPHSLLAILFCLGIGFCHTAHAQDVPKVFETDSTYYKYGAMYSVDNLPAESYRDAKRTGISRDSLRWIVSMGGRDDSVRVFAPISQIRVNNVIHTIIEKHGPETNALGGSFKKHRIAECIEDGALLFTLYYDTEFRADKPRLCRLFRLIIRNFDPSFSYLEFRNVTAYVSPLYPPTKEYPRLNQDTLSKMTEEQIRNYIKERKKHAPGFDMYVEGEIHGERILPDGSILTGKLYDFRIHRKRNHEKDGCILPYNPFMFRK